MRDAELKPRLAREFYLEGRSKVELARMYGISRFQVARLLDEARAEGIVRIEIVDPVDSGTRSDELAQTLGVSSVTIATPRVGEEARTALARQAARIVPEHLPDGGTLGVAWSRTLMHLPEVLGPLPRADVIQLAGSLSSPGVAGSQPSTLVHKIGAVAGGQVWSLPTPLIVDSAPIAASLRSMAEVRTTLDVADGLDVAVVSIGAWADGASTLWSRLGQDERARADEAGIVAECCGILLDRTGAVWHSAIQDRVIAVRPDQLRRTRVVAVAPAEHHPEAVIAAARSGIVDDIVMTAVLAERVIQALANR